jgi:hypothetical protein
VCTNNRVVATCSCPLLVSACASGETMRTKRFAQHPHRTRQTRPGLAERDIGGLTHHLFQNTAEHPGGGSEEGLRRARFVGLHRDGGLQVLVLEDLHRVAQVAGPLVDGQVRPRAGVERRPCRGHPLSKSRKLGTTTRPNGFSVVGLPRRAIPRWTDKPFFAYDHVLRDLHCVFTFQRMRRRPGVRVHRNGPGQSRPRPSLYRTPPAHRCGRVTTTLSYRRTLAVTVGGATAVVTTPGGARRGCKAGDVR